MRSALPTSLLAATVLAAGCRPPLQEAPNQLDALIHFFHQELDGDEALLVGSGAENLSAWFDTAGLVEDGWASGSVTALSQDEVTMLEEMTWEPDATLAVGVYILTVVDCSLDEMMAIYLEPDQLSLFPDNYDAYERSFDSDAGCFADGSCDQVDWHSQVEDSIAGLAMSYRLMTRMKRFAYEDAEGDGTQVVLGRNVMPEPAEENVSVGGFEQSYHIEAYVPRGTDRTLHLYGLWNYGFLEGVSGDAAFWENQYKDGLVDWDERIQQLCTGG